MATGWLWVALEWSTNFNMNGPVTTTLGWWRYDYQGFRCPRISLVAQMVKNLPAMWKTRVWSLGWEDLLEKGMAAHSSILAWRIPWTEEPGGLQSEGLQRDGHDWATNTFRDLKSVWVPQSHQLPRPAEVIGEMEGNFDKYWRMEVSFSPENNCSNGDKVCPAHIFLLSVSLGEAHRNCRAAVFQHGCRSGCLQHKSGLWQPRQWVSHLSLLKRTCHGACSCPQPLATVSWDLLQCYCWGRVLSALLQLLSDHDGVARVEPFLISSGICSLAVFALWCPLGMVETFAELHCSVRLSYYWVVGEPLSS